MPGPLTRSTRQPAMELRPDRALDIGDGTITMGIAHLGE
ncbi:hypothetical protein UFOVP529_62 [uncultured Caudovirales phage]|uniref:Uncharacterized protein n=1 Tax=uncultured Caudovirales phage TaxID=2100421 RepID=A0A6J5RRH1_9CAUD|nr:hypothetical protein UFOVP529_62 [uncultured Caudovirales phage]CAB4190777.1 hypothetical protein UFOVP1191_120 [uncultured Caudovirales phage]CAB4194434.1 hypothetical protein UFOVP1252_59 [uncultured Caudovirales phage]